MTSLQKLEKETVRFGPFADLLANGVRVGDTIYLSGAVSVDGEGNVVGEGDLLVQLRQCYANIGEVLAKYGATLENIVDETWFVTDVEEVMAQLDPLFTARAEAFGKNPDMTQTCVQVAALVFPELLIEVKCVAKI